MYTKFALYAGFMLFAIGIYGIMFNKSVLKSIICLNIMQVGIILFFITIGDNNSLIPPIGEGLRKSDPMPQALMLTAVVIGLAVISLSLTLYISMVRKYGSSYWDKILLKKREEQDED